MSVGACECIDTADCTAPLEALLEELSVPGSPPEGRRPAGSTCAIREPSAEPDCLCHHVWGEMTSPAPENDWILGNRDTCDLFGRVPGTCAVPASEFTGCDPAIADSCEALCDRARELVLADRARTHEGEIRYVDCSSFEAGCYCRKVFRIDDRCYAQTGPNARSHDCALSNAEILALEHPDPPPSCDGPVCDAGRGTPGP
jgi:hypothetical protein